MQKTKTYSIIILLSVVFALYLVEGYLTYNNYRQSNKIQLSKKAKLYKEQTGKEYDTRSVLEVYKDLKKKYENSSVLVPPRFHYNETQNIFPLSGISNSKTIHCNENGYYSIFESDRYGFNNPDTEWDQQQIEYLLVGDSFIHGYCVDRPNDISSVLRTLSKKSVLNLGHVGNGPLSEYAALREYLSPKVKNVLWIYYKGNDLIELRDELNSPILNEYLNDLNFSQNLKLKQNEINEIKKRLINIALKERTDLETKIIYHEEKNKKLKYKVLKFIRLDQLKKLDFKKLKLFESEQKIQIEQFKKILLSANDLAIKNNSKLYFIYLPGYNQYVTVYYNKSHYKLVKKIVNEINIPFIDIDKEVFKKESNPLKLFPFGTSGHYNIEGYRKVAATIHQIISK